MTYKVRLHRIYKQRKRERRREREREKERERRSVDKSRPAR